MDIGQLRRTLSNLQDKDKNILNNIIIDSVPKTDLMLNILDILDETGPYSMTLSEHNRDSLVRLLLRYTDICWPIYLDGVNIGSLVPYMKTIIYHVNADEGYRIATVGEVENGVISLVEEVKDNIPEKDQRLLKLLEWTFSGDWKTFKSLGYESKFNYATKRVETTYMQMLQQCGNELNEMLDYVNDDRKMDSCLTVLRKIKRLGKYKYPQYMPDEIKADISLKQLIYTLKQKLPKGSTDKDIRKAWYLILNVYNNTKYLKSPNPSEVSFLRKIYNELSTNTTYNKVDKKAQEAIRADLKDKCEKLLVGREKRLIDSSHFAFKIIDTLKRSDYVKASVKQTMIIDNALKEMDVNIMAENQKTSNHNNIIDIDSIENCQNMPNIFDVASMLGDGLIGKL